MPTAPCRTLSASTASSRARAPGVGQHVGVGRAGTDQREQLLDAGAGQAVEHPDERRVHLVGRPATHRLQPGRLVLGDPRDVLVRCRRRDHREAVDEPGTASRQRGGHPAARRPAGRADGAAQAEVLQRRGDVVGRVAHGRPRARRHGVAAAVPGPVDRHERDVASSRLLRVGVQQPRSRRGVAQHHRAGVLRAARQHVHGDGAAVAVDGRRLLRVRRHGPIVLVRVAPSCHHFRGDLAMNRTDRLYAIVEQLRGAGPPDAPRSSSQRGSRSPPGPSSATSARCSRRAR